MVLFRRHNKNALTKDALFVTTIVFIFLCLVRVQRVIEYAVDTDKEETPGSGQTCA